jgi:alpha-1,3-glucosyltransferase
VGAFPVSAICGPGDVGRQEPRVRFLADYILSEGYSYYDRACPFIRFKQVRTPSFRIIAKSVADKPVDRFVNSVPASSKHLAHAASLSILLSPGLLIIDHIHFQYNGFLYGILILSIVWARKQSTLLYSGIAFAVLLCLKHIYLYLSLAYFVFLLRAYCLDPKSVFRPRIWNTIKLGVSVATVFGLAFGPFAYWGQLVQLKERLFPFSRGLCHAYWAPNVWAMYSFTDRILIPRMYSHSKALQPH